MIQVLPDPLDRYAPPKRIRRMVAEYAADVELAAAETIPNTWYADPDLYELERRTAFAGWRMVGRADQVMKPGAYCTTEMAGEPIAVVRGDDNVLRAFHNVCRHRAAPVLTEACGHATKLRCRYHGWTYDLAGRLRGAPEFEGVANFCREDYGLVPMAVDEWGPTVWVHDGTPRSSLAEFLAPLPSLTQAFGLDQLVWHARREYELACNWKVYVDNYLDGGYHVHTVHPGLAGVLDYAHYRTELHDHCSIQISPLKPADAGAMVGAVRTGENAYYCWVFPNFMANVYAGVMDTNLVLPLGPDRCRVVFDFYFARGMDPAFIAQSVAVADKIQDEDAGICEEVQRGLRSRSFATGRFSVRRENGGYHFHQLLARGLRQYCR